MPRNLEPKNTEQPAQDLEDRLRKIRGEDVENDTTPEGHSLDEIKLDEKKRELLIYLLEKDGKEKLATQLREKKNATPTKEEADIMEQHRARLSERMFEAERIGNLLTAETLKKVARNHPEFKKIISIGKGEEGPQKAIRAIRGRLLEICVKEEDRFREIADPLETYDDYHSGEHQKLKEEIVEMCKGMGIKEDEYFAALAIKDKKKRAEELWKLAADAIYGKRKIKETAEEKRIGDQNEANGLTRDGKGKKEEAKDIARKFWSFITLKEWRNYKAMAETGDQYESMLEELSSQRSAIGDVLVETINNDEGMMSVLHAEPEPESAAIAPPGTEGQTEAAFNKAAFDASWEKEKATTKYETSSFPEQETIKRKFLEKQAAEVKKKVHRKGFLESMLETLLSAKIADEGKKLK